MRGGRAGDILFKLGRVAGDGAQETWRGAHPLALWRALLGVGVLLKGHHLSQEVGVAGLAARMEDLASAKDEPDLMSTTFEASDLKNQGRPPA